MCESNVKVSILCTTYNQRDYIRDAMDSFLNQKTNFDFEILVNDDASTDGTTELLREYERKYPRIIKVITHDENQYSKGVENLFCEYLYPIARGEYLALCEGDDYWCDPCKLQRQFDLMETRKDCNLCVHASNDVLANTKKLIRVNAPFPNDCVISAGYLMRYAHPFATNSYFIRRAAYEKYAKSPILELKAHGDQKMSTYFGATGEVYYLSKVMSCYRVLAKGSINSRLQDSENFDEQQKLLYSRRLELLDSIDVLTGGLYSKEIIEGKSSMYLYYLESICNLREIKREYPHYYETMPAKVKMKMFVKSHFPGAYKKLKNLVLEKQ